MTITHNTHPAPVEDYHHQARIGGIVKCRRCQSFTDDWVRHSQGHIAGWLFALVRYTTDTHEWVPAPARLAAPVRVEDRDQAEADASAHEGLDPYRDEFTADRMPRDLDWSDVVADGDRMRQDQFDQELAAMVAHPETAKALARTVPMVSGIAVFAMITAAERATTDPGLVDTASRQVALYDGVLAMGLDDLAEEIARLDEGHQWEVDPTPAAWAEAITETACGYLLAVLGY